MPDWTKQKQELIEAGRRIVEKGMIWGSAGNLSMRVGDDQMLITASGSRLGMLTEEDIVLWGPSGGDGKKPSKEFPLHQAIYRSCPKAGCVIHATPFYTTMAACSSGKLIWNLFVEAMYYLEHVGRIPFSNPGSQALAADVERACTSSNILLMENHGVLLFEESMQEGLTALEVLEVVCKMNLTCPSSVSLKQPDPNQIQDFLERSGYKPCRNLFDR